MRYRAYFRGDQRDFLLVATPGAGKTTFALTIAAELIARREISAVTVVTPTEHLKHQWAQAAHRLGIALDPEFTNAQGRASADFTGVAVTYAQVAAHPALHRQRTLSQAHARGLRRDPSRRRRAVLGRGDPGRVRASPAHGWR